MSKPLPFLPGSVNELTAPNKSILNKRESPRPHEGGSDFLQEISKSFNQTIHNANIVPISAEFIAEVELARHISFEEAPTVLPGHVYAHLYTKYQGGASAETVQILEVIAGVDYKHTCVNSMDSPLDADGTVNDIPNLSDADIRRMSTLHKFYDVVTSASLPKPGDKISVQYTDSNPNAGGALATAATYPAAGLDDDSGEQIYVEYRAPINRASDQTEDVKLVVEF